MKELAREPQDAEKTKLKSRLTGRFLPTAQTTCESPSIRETRLCFTKEEHRLSALMNVNHGQVVGRGLMKTALIVSLHQVIPVDGWPPGW